MILWVFSISIHSRQDLSVFLNPTIVLALLHAHAHAHTLHQTPAKEMPKKPAVNSLKPKNPVKNERYASCNRSRETPIVTISEAQISDTMHTQNL